jgi:hypothetical protein
MESYQQPIDVKKIIGTGADTPYWFSLRIAAIAQLLDTLASSEEQLWLSKYEFHIPVYLEMDESQNRAPPELFLVETISRSEGGTIYTNTDNSLEGFIGASLIQNEFEYNVLGRLFPYSIAIGQSGQLCCLYKASISRKISKKQKKIFRSSEQMTDTPNVFKDIFIIGRVDGTANYVYNIYTNGHVELFFTRREKGLFTDTYI